MQIQADVPIEIIDVIQAVILFFLARCHRPQAVPSASRPGRSGRGADSDPSYGEQTVA